MKLDAWFEIPNPDGTRKSKSAFAERIGVTPQMISAYCGDDPPWMSRQVFQRIFVATNGEVTPNDYLGLPLLRKAA
jgi:3,4-dihydroxy 2-butanone 4-phosphate synthase/GTP cyclohydrolase II